MIDLALPQGRVIRRAISEVLAGNALGEAGVRLTITAGAGPIDVQADPDDGPNVIVIAWPVRDYTDLYARGAALVSLGEGGRPLAGVKSTSYALSVAGRVAARRANADDAVFVTADGRVLEATGSNLFVVRGRTIATPPLDEAILPGVTRAFVIGVARDCGFDVEETPLVVNDVIDAEEVFLTSSLREVYPARSFDGRELGRGEIAEQLRKAYGELVERSL